MAELDLIQKPLPKTVKPFHPEHLARDLGSGSIAGFFTVFLGHPLDTVKVRMQVLGGNFLKTAISIVKEEGFLSLYKGVRSPLYSAPIMSAISFASYELGNRVQGFKPGDKITLSSAFLSGAWTGLVFVPFITPIDLLKCRQQIRGIGSHVKGPKTFDLARSIIREQGFRGLFKGITITWIRDIPGVGAQFAVYEETRRILNKTFGKSHFWSFIAGGAGTVVGWIFAYPQDTIKTRIQCATSPLGIKDCSREIYRESGLKGFWKGISPCLIRAVLIGAVRYVVYEKCQRLFGRDKAHH